MSLNADATLRSKMGTDFQNAASIGVILAPMIFGTTRFLQRKRDWFSRRLGAADILEIYDGNKKYSVPPNALDLIRGTVEVHRNRLDELAASFDEERLFTQIDRIIAQQLSRGVRRIGLFGFGFGANVFLRYCESRTSSSVTYVACWHPHLVFSQHMTATKAHWALSEPDVVKIPSSIHVTIFHGQSDGEVLQGNLERARAWTSRYPHIELIEYPKTGHAFSDRNVQGSIPNLKYYSFSLSGRRAHKQSWDHAYVRLRALAV